MKNGILFFAGIFTAVIASWVAIVLWTHAQIGALTPYYDDGEGNSFPERTSGVAAQGEQVYASLGCVSCHTQQVRRPDFGSDAARGWGDRQTVARDYIFQARPQLGSLRQGPDLANFGGRKPNPPDPAALLHFLYAGSPTHPSYSFLFETRALVGQRSVRALELSGDRAPDPGYQVVPTARADALVAYLLGLKTAYEYPEARPLPPEAAETAEPAPTAPAGPAAPTPSPAAQPSTQPSPETEKSNPPGKRPEQAVPAAAPDENKKLPNK